ncbi:diacylglycerol/lipid kinase family protein [Lutimonas sp.]|uniref:diacylglycerol/lipid kinase family protein n=1 Tax=Lutimonas sp. TaxID=1872403 RepID=UPI003D9AE1B1
MKVLILVNLDANHKKAKKKWELIAGDILRLMPGTTEIIKFTIPFDIKTCIHDQIVNNGLRNIISAGGDGTANMILNTLLHDPKIIMSELNIGFIGLGSSNDLLKPVTRSIKDIPLKIDVNNVTPVDLGLALFMDENQKLNKKLFLGNSSIGVGASANWLFNKEDFIIHNLKSRWTNLTILYTTIKSIFNFKNYRLCMKYKGLEKERVISYLAVLKTRHISGKMRFDQKILSNDGRMGLNFCENMNKQELIMVMKDLHKGVFSGRKKRHSCFVKELFIKSKVLIPVEFDGEIEMAKEVSYSILPKAINRMQ